MTLPRLAGGAQLGLRPHRPRQRPEPLELLAGTPQMRTGVDPATSPAKVLAVQQLGAGLVPGTARHAVQLQSSLEPITDLRPVTVHHGAGASRQSARPVWPGRSGELLERNQGGARGLDIAAADRTLDEVRGGEQSDAGMGLAVTRCE